MSYNQLLITSSPLADKIDEVRQLTEEIVVNSALDDVTAIQDVTDARDRLHRLTQQMRARMITDRQIIGNLPMDMLGGQLGMTGQMVSVLRDQGPKFYVIIYRPASGYVMDVEEPRRPVVRTRIQNGGVPVPSRYWLDSIPEERLRDELDLSFWYEQLKDMALYTG